MPEWIDHLNDFTEENFDATLIEDSDTQASAEAVEGVTTYLRDHAADVLSGLGSALGVVFSIFTIGLFTFYLTAEGPKVRKVLLSRLPPHRQHDLLWAWNTAIDKTGGYLYSRALLALINGALMFVTLLLVGTPYALVLAVFSGVVAAFIPIVGTYIAGAVPVVVTLAAGELVPAVIVLAEIVIYQQLENYVLSPRLSKKTMELHPGCRVRCGPRRRRRRRLHRGVHRPAHHRSRPILPVHLLPALRSRRRQRGGRRRSRGWPGRSQSPAT